MMLIRSHFTNLTIFAALLAVVGLILALTLFASSPAAAQSLTWSSTVADQEYTQGTEIAQLTLPTVTDSGSYTYTLSPSSPPDGITYDSTARTWTGTPTADAAGPPATYYWIATDGTPGKPPTLRITLRWFTRPAP